MDKETMTVMVAGVVAILGVLLPGIVTIITALRTSKAVEAVAVVNAEQSGKLDGIGHQLDGQRSELLDRIVSLEELLAKKSGDLERLLAAKKAVADHKESIE